MCVCVCPLTTLAGQVSRWAAVFHNPPSACCWLAQLRSYCSWAHLERSLALSNNFDVWCLVTSARLLPLADCFGHPLSFSHFTTSSSSLFYFWVHYSFISSEDFLFSLLISPCLILCAMWSKITEEMRKKNTIHLLKNLNNLNLSQKKRRLVSAYFLKACLPPFFCVYDCLVAIATSADVLWYCLC